MARKGKADEWLQPDGLLQIEGWAREGLIDKQIAKNIGIAERTLMDWKIRYPAITSALKKGKAPVDIEVENALLKSALGYSVKVKKPIKVKSVKMKDGMKLEEERVEYADEEVHIPANITAQIFWLKNRKPQVWRDKQVIENTGDGKLAELIDGLRDAKAARGREENDGNS